MEIKRRKIKSPQILVYLESMQINSSYNAMISKFPEKLKQKIVNVDTSKFASQEKQILKKHNKIIVNSTSLKAIYQKLLLLCSKNENKLLSTIDKYLIKQCFTYHRLLIKILKNSKFQCNLSTFTKVDQIKLAHELQCLQSFMRKNYEKKFVQQIETIQCSTLQRQASIRDKTSIEDYDMLINRYKPTNNIFTPDIFVEFNKIYDQISDKKKSFPQVQYTIFQNLKKAQKKINDVFRQTSNNKENTLFTDLNN